MSKKSQNTYGEVDQILVRVGKTCNFKCNFCNVSDNEKHIKNKENIDDIIRNFLYKFKYSKIVDGEIIVTISGGEPSIFKKETLFALKFIKSFLDKKNIKVSFEIQTNASNITFNFAKHLKKLGVELALVSFHTQEEKIFEKIIGVNYNENIKKVERGINYLNEAGIKIDTNTLISNENKTDFLNTIKYLSNNFPFIETFNIGILQPHGEASINMQEKCPKYEDIADIYNKSIYFLDKQDKKVISHLVGLPGCYIGDISKSLEIIDNIEYRKNHDYNNKGFLINNLNSSNKNQAEDCNYCLYNNVCSGIWKEYLGFQKLKPINYVIDYFGDFKLNDFAVKIKNIEDLNIENIKNIKQLIIPSSIINKDFNVITKSLKLGICKISLHIDGKFNIDDILLSGIGNIQVNINNIDIYQVEKIIKFSEKISHQFRIDLDIIIDDYNLVLKEKLEKILKHVDSKFLKLFFVLKGDKQKIQKYNDVIDFIQNKNIYIIN